LSAFYRERQIVKKVIPACPSNYSEGRRYPIQGVVIHTMSGHLGSETSGTGHWFGNCTANGGRPSFVSAHYGVGLNGTVHQYVRERDAAYHAGTVYRPTARLVRDRPRQNPNDYTVGIETEDGALPWRVRPEAQVAAVVELCYRICRGYGIVPSLDTIIPHNAVRASKPCPGAFPVAEVVRRVQARFLALT
jgi:N-acetylmuramoyl-L-alanine amidase